MSEPKQFKNQEEIYAHLVRGGSIFSYKLHPSNYFKLKEGYLHEFQIKDDTTVDKWSFHFDAPECWYEYIKKEWYDDIPEKGIPCWVSDFSAECRNHIAFITEYKKGSGIPYPYKGSNGYKWVFATPIKPGEIDQFLFKKVG